MGKNIIHRLILEYFTNEVSGETRKKFHRWFTQDEFNEEKAGAMADIWENHTAHEDNQQQAELANIHKRIDRYEKGRVLLLYKRILQVTAILLLPLLGGVCTYYLKPDKVVIRELELVECFVPYGEQKHILLADGSEVWVNAGSILIYAKKFEGDTRTLYLNGEANFNVAKNPSKPFIVRTEYMDVEALGTSFNIQSYADAENYTTTLETGKVKINTKDENTGSFILQPDEQVVYNRINRTATKKKVEAIKNTRWKLGYLTFQSNTFDDIMKAIERKYGVTVTYDTNRFRGKTFTIRFSPDESLDQILEILKDIGDFNYKMKGNVISITR